jgi:uncharacterized MAPEG superfamily protein
MGKDLYYLAASAILTLVMVLIAATLRARAWTPEGLAIAVGNRENLPAATPLAGRAERAARNMVDNMVLFAVVMLAAHIAGVLGPRVALGAEIFFWARLVYFPTYLAGIAYLRTVVWLVSIVGLGIIVSALTV